MKIFLALAALVLVCGCGNPVLQQRGDSAACTAPVLAPCPAAPILDVQPSADGGICLDANDARELLLYVRELEQRCRQEDD